jgi:hypothetical protein
MTAAVAAGGITMDVDVDAIMGSVIGRRPDPADAVAVSAWMLGTIGVLHAPVYRSRGLRARLAAHGVTNGMAAYFAQRSAPLGLPDGRPSARLVAATFYGFSPAVVATHVPAVWDALTPAQALEETFGALRELFGGLFAEHGAAVEELASLLGPVADAHEVAGRPLAAAWADVPRPGEPILDLWLATCVIRESRGDGHLALLVTEGIGPLESHLVTAGDRPEGRDALQGLRGWTEAEVDAAVEGLRGRGLLDADGRRTERCRELRRDIERRTDELSARAWSEVGPDAVTRIGDLALGLLPPVLASGTLLPPVFERLTPRG